MLYYQEHCPSDLQDNAPWLILLHGRGADEDDLLALAEFFPGHLVVAPRAPFTAMQWNYGPGYAWYRYLGGTTPDPEHFEHSQNELHVLINALPDLLDVRPGPLFLGGFSQGGTMSMGYTLRNPGVVTTTLNLSGFLPDHPSVQVTPETVNGTYFYWAHGLYDKAIPLQIAQQGRRQLQTAGAYLAAVDLPISHTISYNSITDIQTLLDL